MIIDSADADHAGECGAEDEEEVFREGSAKFRI